MLPNKIETFTRYLFVFSKSKCHPTDSNDIIENFTEYLTNELYHSGIQFNLILQKH